MFNKHVFTQLRQEQNTKIQIFKYLHRNLCYHDVYLHSEPLYKLQFHIKNTLIHIRFFRENVCCIFRKAKT